MRRKIWDQGASRLKQFLLLLSLAAAFGAERPPIVGIANFVVKTDNLEEARKFYSGVLGYDEVFQHRRPGNAADIAVFKVNDQQYIEVTPTLANESDDKLIQIGFETKDARKLRDYLAAKGVTVPARAGKDEDGNYSFVVKDPEGHQVEFVEYVKGSLHSRHFGEGLSTRRISDHMLHVGVHVKDAGRAGQVLQRHSGISLSVEGRPAGRPRRLDFA